MSFSKIKSQHVCSFTNNLNTFDNRITKHCIIFQISQCLSIHELLRPFYVLKHMLQTT